MKQLSILVLVFSSIYSFGQDTLYTVNGQKIPGKVIEINQNEIKYKKADNPDGPIYVVDKNDIALIEYKNGSKELYGTGSGSADQNDQQIANNNSNQQTQGRSRINIVLGGWGWGGWPIYNSWNWWGPRYRSYGYFRSGHHHGYRAQYHCVAPISRISYRGPRRSLLCDIRTRRYPDHHLRAPVSI